MPPLTSLNKTCLALAISHSIALSANTDAAVIIVDSNTDDGAGCTLREAIVSANTLTNRNNGCALGSDTGTTDTITFANNLVGNTIAITQGELSIGLGKDIAIDASNIAGGITIDANFQSRLLSIASASVSLNSITLSRGGTQGGEQSINAIEVQYSSLSLSNSTISNNLSGYGYQDSMLNADNSIITISDSRISNNSLNYSSLIRVKDAVNFTLENSVITGNQAPGDILFLRTDNASVDNTTISNNTSRSGSVLETRLYTSISITNSTIAGNTLVDGAINVFGSATITNSTVSGNSLSSRASLISDGGGVRAPDGVINLINTTVANNAAPNVRLVSVNADRPTVTLTNSVITNAIGGADCAISFFASFNNISSDSNSIVKDGSCNTQARSVDPLLGPLTDNGGPTLTHGLLPGSPAINTGDNATCAATDQRGEKRRLSSDDACDVGAFELIVGQNEPDEGSFFVVPTKNGKAVIFEL